MQTREQKYAASAYQAVNALSKSGLEDKQSYGGMAHKLPILIHTAGLAQALAFVDARGKASQRQLLTDLAGTIGKASKDTLLASARNAELSEYMHLTQQIMDALLWYKRFAQSVLDVDSSTMLQVGGDTDGKQS